MAAPARTLSGSRFLRPKLSRFFNQVAKACPRISRFMKGTAALIPLLPDVFSSRFLAGVTATPKNTASPRTMGSTLFLRPGISRFFNEVAKARPRISRFMKGKAALIPPMPDIFSSRFFTKPRTPASKPSHLKPHWPGKPKGPGR